MFFFVIHPSARSKINIRCLNYWRLLKLIMTWFLAGFITGSIDHSLDVNSHVYIRFILHIIRNNNYIMYIIYVLLTNPIFCRPVTFFFSVFFFSFSFVKLEMVYCLFVKTLPFSSSFFCSAMKYLYLIIKWRYSWPLTYLLLPSFNLFSLTFWPLNC